MRTAFFALAFTLCAIAFVTEQRAASPATHRVGSAAALAPVCLLVLLGAAWPSLYTLMAVAASPSIPMLLLAIAIPSFAVRPWVRGYTVFSVLLSLAAFVLLAAQ